MIALFYLTLLIATIGLGSSVVFAWNIFQKKTTFKKVWPKGIHRLVFLASAGVAGIMSYISVQSAWSTYTTFTGFEQSDLESITKIPEEIYGEGYSLGGNLAWDLFLTILWAMLGFVIAYLFIHALIIGTCQCLKWSRQIVQWVKEGFKD